MHSTDLAPVLSATSNRDSVWIISLFPTCIPCKQAEKPTCRNQSWTRHTLGKPLAELLFGQITTPFARRSPLLCQKKGRVQHVSEIFLLQRQSFWCWTARLRLAEYSGFSFEPTTVSVPRLLANAAYGPLFEIPAIAARNASPLAIAPTVRLLPTNSLWPAPPDRPPQGLWSH